MIEKHPGYVVLASKTESFHIKEEETRRDMGGEPLHEDLIYGYEYNYIREFLDCFSCKHELNFFDMLDRLGDEAGNHNQLLYFCKHIMPYLIKDAPEHLQRYFRVIKDACETAYRQTEMWNEWDENRKVTPKTKEVVVFSRFMDKVKDECKEAPWEEIQGCVIDIISGHLLS
jgi:hypothetical protein